jgi:hypothetical protein
MKSNGNSLIFLDARSIPERLKEPSLTDTNDILNTIVEDILSLTTTLEKDHDVHVA